MPKQLSSSFLRIVSSEDRDRYYAIHGKTAEKDILPDSVLASGLGRIFMDVKISMSETSTPFTSFETRNAASATSSRTVNPSPPQRDLQ